MMRGWRRLHGESFHNLYSSSHIMRVIKSRRMIWAGHVAHVEEMKNVYKILVRKCEGKRPLGRLRQRWEDNMRMDLREIWWEGADWMHLA
jgi:hypothetical protein